MRFLKTRLFFTLIVVMCLGVAFLSVTRAHAASGCSQSSDGEILACISINSNRMVIPDGYVTNNDVLPRLTIELQDISDNKNSTQISLTNVSGHFFGKPIPMVAGHTYSTDLGAILPDGKTSIVANSPIQTT